MSPRFPYHLPYATLNLRTSPHLYRIGRGEEGVLSVEPYKSELLPLWKFKNPEVAQESSKALYMQFEEYRKNKDFVGCDMARKFIQMGVTRARRYANHKGGRKYQVTEDGKEKIELPRDQVEDPVKAEAARIFGVVLKKVQEDEEYIKLAEKHRELYDHIEIPQTEGQVDVKQKQIGEKPKKVTLAQARKRKRNQD